MRVLIRYVYIFDNIIKIERKRSENAEKKNEEEDDDSENKKKSKFSPSRNA